MGEAECEYAARAGTKTARYWGDRAEDGCAFENMADLSLKRDSPDVPVPTCGNGPIADGASSIFQGQPMGTL